MTARPLGASPRASRGASRSCLGQSNARMTARTPHAPLRGCPFRYRLATRRETATSARSHRTRTRPAFRVSYLDCAPLTGRIRGQAARPSRWVCQSDRVGSPVGLPLAPIAPWWRLQRTHPAQAGAIPYRGSASPWRVNRDALHSPNHAAGLTAQGTATPFALRDICGGATSHECCVTRSGTAPRRASAGAAASGSAAQAASQRGCRPQFASSNLIGCGSLGGIVISRKD